MLVSRSTSKLDAAAQELKSEYNVDTQQLTVDFSTADAQTYSQLSDSLSGLDIGVLVNNVGLSYDHAEYYDKIDDQLIDDLVAINIQATNKAGQEAAQLMTLHTSPVSVLSQWTDSKFAVRVAHRHP